MMSGLLDEECIFKYVIFVDSVAIMTSETSSAADSPGLLHRPLLTSSTEKAAGEGITSDNLNLEARFSPSTVRFLTVDMDQKSIR